MDLDLNDEGMFQGQVDGNHGEMFPGPDLSPSDGESASADEMEDIEPPYVFVIECPV
jgi:hypothetical protein